MTQIRKNLITNVMCLIANVLVGLLLHSLSRKGVRGSHIRSVTDSIGGKSIYYYLDRLTSKFGYEVLFFRV